MTIPFVKMHGAGNDFVVLDNRDQSLSVDGTWAKKLADRRFGVGCDTVVVLEKSDKADVFARFYNHDGSQSSACGNASRCIGWKMMQEQGSDAATLETNAGVLKASRAGDHLVTVDMGAPRLEAKDIPLSENRNTLHLGISEGPLMDPVAVNMGNPHMVFFVRSLDTIDIAKQGPILCKHPLYPRQCNVSAVQVLDSDHLKMKVWERGAGETLACGTAACAAVVAGHRRELCNNKAEVQLPGGTLIIEWDTKENIVRMTGPVAEVYSAHFDEKLIAA